MPTPRQITARKCAAQLAPRNASCEVTIGWLVLLAIAMSILAGIMGHGDIEGKEKNGVRRAASQLERKVVKGDTLPMARPAFKVTA